MLIDQLRDILVAGGNDDAHAFFFRLFRQTTDDIIGFHTVHAK